MKEICALPADDNVTFTYIGDSEIKKDDIYGGFSVSLEGRLENIRQRFDVDVATNDVVYPHDLDYSYTCLLTNEAIQIKSYSVESVIAEKMQTFLSKGVLNSRAKDFYDLYALSMQKEKYKNNLRITFEKTCKSREYETSKDEALGTLHLVESSKAQRQRWQAYAKKMKYAKNISFDDTIQSIEKLIDVLF